MLNNRKKFNPYFFAEHNIVTAIECVNYYLDERNEFYWDELQEEFFHDMLLRLHNFIDQLHFVKKENLDSLELQARKRCIDSEELKLMNIELMDNGEDANLNLVDEVEETLKQFKVLTADQQKLLLWQLDRLEANIEIENERYKRIETKNTDYPLVLDDLKKCFTEIKKIGQLINTDAALYLEQLRLLVIVAFKLNGKVKPFMQIFDPMLGDSLGWCGGITIEWIQHIYKHGAPNNDLLVNKNTFYFQDEQIDILWNNSSVVAHISANANLNESLSKVFESYTHEPKVYYITLRREGGGHVIGIRKLKSGQIEVLDSNCMSASFPNQSSFVHWLMVLIFSYRMSNLPIDSIKINYLRCKNLHPAEKPAFLLDYSKDVKPVTATEINLLFKYFLSTYEKTAKSQGENQCCKYLLHLMQFLITRINNQETLSAIFEELNQFEKDCQKFIKKNEEPSSRVISQMIGRFFNSSHPLDKAIKEIANTLAERKKELALSANVNYSK